MNCYSCDWPLGQDTIYVEGHPFHAICTALGRAHLAIKRKGK